jgi:hypothetical protein
MIQREDGLANSRYLRSARIMKIAISLPVVLLTAYVSAGGSSVYDSLSPGARSLFDETMSLNEMYWDDIDGYLYSIDTAGVHDTRATAMWATALLARNGNNGSDVATAVRIFEQISVQQYTDNVTAPWYGTFPHSPQDPFPGTSLLGVIPYTAFDPNW